MYPPQGHIEIVTWLILFFVVSVGGLWGFYPFSQTNEFVRLDPFIDMAIQLEDHHEVQDSINEPASTVKLLPRSDALGFHSDDFNVGSSPTGSRCEEENLKLGDGAHVDLGTPRTTPATANRRVPSSNGSQKGKGPSFACVI